MIDIKNKFQAAKRDIELEIVRNNIDLLRQYIDAQDDNARNKIQEQMHALTRGLLSKGYTPEDLITRLEKAIKLNEYRPKNLSLFLLAKSDDLDYIGGEFNTFNPNLSKLSKNIEKNAAEIRNEFNVATINRVDLAQQFTQDWIRRLTQHKGLTNKVRNANSRNEKITAYDELFRALGKDFCDEYDIPQKVVDIKVVENWDKSDIKPSSAAEETPAYVTDGWGIEIPNNVSKEEHSKIIAEFTKSPKTYPGAFKKKLVRINFDITNNDAQKHEFEPFVIMCANFGHEMNHVLDALKPREGALGPQVQPLDKQTYVGMEKDKTEYHKSATELASYEVTYEMVKQLKDLWRENY